MSAASSSAVIYDETSYNNIIDGTPFGGIGGLSFMAFKTMTESGLGILLGQTNIVFGKRGELLALKAQLSSQQGKSNSSSYNKTKLSFLPSFN
jgi:hypothetical protein